MSSVCLLCVLAAVSAAIRPAVRRRTNPAHNTNGDERCPCISHEQQQAILLRKNAALCNANATINGARPPASYGWNLCLAHDATALYCTDVDDSVPDWCPKLWCYVDMDRCERRSIPSDLFHDSGIYYSYATCGNLDKFYAVRHTEFLISLKTVRVSYPPDDERPFLVSLNHDEEHLFEKAGALPAFVREVLSSYGVRAVESKITELSYAWSPQSSYTACVHHLALNRTDLCIGPFWATASRRDFADFSPMFYAEEMRLLTFRAGIVSSMHVDSETFTSPFEPFSAGLWLLIIASLFVFGVGMWLMEGAHHVEVDPEQNVDLPQRTPATRLAASTAMAWLSFFNAFIPFSGTRKDVVPLIAILAAGFACRTLLIQYSALVLQNLLIDNAHNSGQNIRTFDDLVARKYKLCVAGAMRDSLMLARPELGSLVVTAPDHLAGTMIAMMDAGLCEASAVSPENWLSYASEFGTSPQPEFDCNRFVLLNARLLFFEVSLPVVDALVKPLGWAFRTAIAQGRFDHHKKEASRVFLGQTCDANEGKTSVAFSQAGVGFGLGPCLIMLVGTGVAVLLHYVCRCIGSQTQSVEMQRRSKAARGVLATISMSRSGRASPSVGEPGTRLHTVDME